MKVQVQVLETWVIDRSRKAAGWTISMPQVSSNEHTAVSAPLAYRKLQRSHNHYNDPVSGTKYPLKRGLSSSPNSLTTS